MLNKLSGRDIIFALRMRMEHQEDNIARKGTKLPWAVWQMIPNIILFLSTENECANYKVLNESDRSQTNHTSVTALKCDHWIYNFEPDRWNRFEGAAGQTMALKPVAPYRCSSIMSGWMNDKHPEVAEAKFSPWKSKYAYNAFILHFSTKYLVKRGIQKVLRH